MASLANLPVPVNRSLADVPVIPSLVQDLGISGTSVFLTIIAGLTYYLHDLTSDPINTDDKLIENEYDFVIIGAGSAGSVVANRLSEICDWKILVLEAGILENPITDIPLIAASSQLSCLDWQFKTEPEPTSCLGMTDGRCNWPRGKVVGGSSVLNYMLYVRGNKGDYDYWEAQGNPGWGWEDVLPYFKKSEDNQNPELVATDYHSSGGLLTVMQPPYHTPLVDAFVAAGCELGYENGDYNGPNQTRFSKAQATLRNGSRCSTGKAFAKPASSRSNLHISLESHVSKILIDSETKKAYGAEYNQHGNVKTARARKEVILCAGAIGTTQILMLSGIGPEEHLQDLGIPVLQNLSVGRNLQDHPGLGGLTFLVNGTYGIDLEKVARLDTVYDYLVNGEGPLTIPGAVEGLAFLKTKFCETDYPDVEFHFVAGSTNTDFGVQTWKAHGITHSFYKKVYQPIEGKDCWSILPMLLRPNSRGEIKLKSTDPYDHPLLYPNYLTDPQDIKVLVEGVKIAIKLSETEAFQKYGSKFHDITYPGCEDCEPYSDEMWECMIRHYTFIFSHFSGTAKMGPSSDPDAVVDPELRVYGIEGLRVVDASIMPNVTSGNMYKKFVKIVLERNS